MFDSRTIRFDYLEGLEVVVKPAVLDLNPIYQAATIAYVQPLRLAAQLPDDHPRRLTEERAVAALVKAYAAAVMIAGDRDGMDDWRPHQWETWLAAHPEEFQSIRDVAEVRTNFVSEEEEVAAAAASDLVN
jgi:hypothetical protein